MPMQPTALLIRMCERQSEQITGLPSILFTQLLTSQSG